MDGGRLRVGIIGAGVGALHLAAYIQLPRVEIVALAGLDDDRVRRVAADAHCAPRLAGGLGVCSCSWRPNASQGSGSVTW